MKGVVWPVRVLSLQYNDCKIYNKTISDARGGEDLLDMSAIADYDSWLLSGSDFCGIQLLCYQGYLWKFSKEEAWRRER